MAKPRHGFVGFRLIGLRDILGCHTEDVDALVEVCLTGTPKNVVIWGRLLDDAQNY